MSQVQFDRRIMIPSADYDYLIGLSRGAMRTLRHFPPLLKDLADILDRAEVVSSEALPPEVITLGSHVAYRDEVIDAHLSVTLTRAGEEHLGARRVSVLSPFGLQLLGSREGERLEWRTFLGGRKGVTINRVWQFGSDGLTGWASPVLIQDTD